MSYVERNLAPGEEIVHRARLTWLNWLAALACLVALGWLLGFGIILALAFAIRQWTTEIAITNRRFIYKTGWISRRVQDISLAKIEGSSLEQSVLGRLLGYGRLTIRGTGIGAIDLPGIDAPNALKRAIDAGAQTLRAAEG